MMGTPLQQLVSTGLRRTRASEAVLALFMGQHGTYLSHHQAEAALRQNGVRVHRVTLYRLLGRFVSAGLLREQIGEDRVRRYAWLPEPETSCESHFECLSCHSLFQPSPPPEGLEQLLAQLATDPAWAAHRPEQISLTLRGLCASCQAQRPC
ncbi:MAG: hypothetical protein C0462_08500 [Alcanivorax sp.]|nr:hypothetical protein [Alcanivorax sp.]